MLSESQRSFEGAYLGDERNPIYSLGLGWIFDEMKNYPEAIRWYERALRLRPTFVEARYNIGCALAKSGEPEQAYNTILPIKDEPVVRRCLEDQSEVKRELAAIKTWNSAKFRILLGETSEGNG